MTEATDTIRRRTWLHMAETRGRRWSARELADELGYEPAKVSNALVTLFYGDCIKRFPVPGRLLQSNYEVTGECVAPKCVTVDELSEVLRRGEELVPHTPPISIASRVQGTRYP